MTYRSPRTTGLLTGVLLGLGAPLGGLFFNVLFSGSINLGRMINEVQEHSYYYFYMMLTTPIVMGFFGYYLGGLNENIHVQKRSLENLMNVLETQSMTDDVTGIYNHRHLLEEIEKEVERSRRYDHYLSGIMVDVDDFKEINDLYGHLTGDSVLREIALVLNESIRKIDILGRYGGDEFVVILPEAQICAAQVVAERILQSIRQRRFKTKRDYISLTVSIGLFSFENSNDLDKNQFVERIDQAMFEAKKLGKNRSFTVS